MAKKKLDASFPRSLKVILREEGGNDDDPYDHGGRTSRGIIQREWDAFRKTHSGRPADVWEASHADVATIYREQYWQPYCAEMPAGVDLCFFNASVNSGRFQAVKELQRALGVNDDGWIGIITRTALATHKDVGRLVKDMNDRRRRFYRGLAQCPRYCRGWLARTDRVEHDAQLLLTGKFNARHVVPLDKAELGRAKAYPPRLEVGAVKVYPPGG